MNKELIEDYIKNQIKTMATENNVDKDTLLVLRRVLAKCNTFADIIDYREEIPACDITGLDGYKLFDWWRALDILKCAKVTEEVLPETIDAVALHYNNEAINYSLNRVLNFTTEDPEYPSLCVIVACQMKDAVLLGFTYNSKKVLKSFINRIDSQRIPWILRREKVKLLPEDVAYKYDFVKLPVKTQRIFAGYVASKMTVETLTYDGPYGKCTYSNRYIEERVDEYGKPALYQIYDYYGYVSGDYDLTHMHLGGLRLCRSFAMHELLCNDLTYSGCIRPINLEGFDDEAIELFERMSKQKPDNWDILVYLRDNSHGELDKLPRASVLDCKSKEEADELLALIPE